MKTAKPYSNAHTERKVGKQLVKYIMQNQLTLSL